MTDDPLEIGDRQFDSRLIMGTARYPNHRALLDSLRASETELVTVSIRRVDLEASRETGIIDLVTDEFELLPNTAGCYTAKDAVLTAQLAREALGTDLIKLEVVGDEDLLLPDGEELLKAARELVEEGFSVMAYSNDDPILCKKLEAAGCEAVMPAGSPIGSGMGIQNPYNIRIIVEELDVPVFVDAGIGIASDAAMAMELGCEGVLLNTAVARAKEPERMAEAFRDAVRAGRAAYRAGRIPKRLYAEPSSPTEGLVETDSSDD
ncbi:MAG: thiazole synthase [Bradymonadaceae bacterium]